MLMAVNAVRSATIAAFGSPSSSPDQRQRLPAKREANACASSDLGKRTTTKSLSPRRMEPGSSATERAAEGPATFGGGST
jgi:hypothetical protein